MVAELPPGASPLLLVGAGKMGGAMLERWLRAGVAPDHVTILDPFIADDQRAIFSHAGVRIASAPAEVSGGFSILLMAVKPQSMTEALPSVAYLAGPETTVISVAAGIRLATLEAAFPAGQPVVRVMPNTPAQVGQGMSVAVPNGHVSDDQRAALEVLFSVIGKIAWTEDEAHIDAVTAVSGSGPAYVFLLAECLAEAGRRAGLPADLADLLGRQTVVGAGALLGDSPLAAAELRRNVTSPKGTTQAALDVLMAEDGLQPLIARAVEAARKRSVELG
jgi:pyrroline-5-carboxylate reductase